MNGIAKESDGAVIIEGSFSAAEIVKCRLRIFCTCAEVYDVAYVV